MLPSNINIKSRNILYFKRLIEKKYRNEKKKNSFVGARSTAYIIYVIKRKKN